jgi:hypothetical protein
MTGVHRTGGETVLVVVREDAGHGMDYNVNGKR